MDTQQTNNQQVNNKESLNNLADGYNYLLQMLSKGQKGGIYDILESRNIYECLTNYKKSLEGLNEPKSEFEVQIIDVINKHNNKIEENTKILGDVIKGINLINNNIIEISKVCKENENSINKLKESLDEITTE